MSQRLLSRAARIAGCGLLFASPFGAGAAPVFTPWVDISAGVGYSRNPLLVNDGDAHSGLAEFSITPSLEIAEQNGSGTISAFYRRDEYFRRYDSSEDYGANAFATVRLNPLLTVRGSMGYESSIIGRRNLLDPLDFSEPEPTTSPVVVVPVPDIEVVDLVDVGDVGLIGLGQRRSTVRGTIGATMTPSERETWSADFFGNRTRYPNRGLGADYTNYGGTLGYSRALSDTTSVGAQLSVSRADYEMAGADATIIDPEITLNTRLANGWVIGGGIGVSITRRKLLDGSNDNSTALSGRLNACKEGERSSTCVRVSRASSATGFGGVRRTLSAGASYSYRFNETTTARGDLSYSRASGRQFVFLDNQMLGVDDKDDYLTATAAVERRMSERVTLIGSTNYRDSYSDDFEPKADITGMVSVRVRLGSRR